MSNLILSFNKVEFWDDARMFFEPCFSNSKQILNAILCFLFDLSFMQQSLKSLENCGGSSRCDLGKHLPNFYHKIAGNLHRILSRGCKKDQQDLQSDILSQYSLVHQMSNHLGRGHAYNFIVPFERPLKLNDNSLGNQQSDFPLQIFSLKSSTTTF